ncbi:hypothetical protein N0V83_000121 [Neocucurbitaria cava]|uniref:Ubiquitin-like protease family profile domain-containing protein n=1 Tax=Neocucurbitaria cava TaxID=798079 RepID=A0A9W8YJ88_9PLEO|nr:hypothetical protein N0V83_000121 [Neocucurbitaria cava]
MNKPGSNNSFRPVNTINEINPAARTRMTTYSAKHSRRSVAPIGQTRHAGQLAYLDRERETAPTATAHNVFSRTEQARTAGGASSAKRRRSEVIIDVSDDEDVEDNNNELRGVEPPSVSYARAGTSYDMPLSARSSQSKSLSHLSDGSGSAITTVKHPSQPKSAFLATEDFFEPHRKKQRTPSSNRRQGTQRIPSLSGNSFSGSFEVHEPIVTESVHENVIGRHESARRSILDDFKQGESARSSDERQQQSRRHDTITSRHFTKARINESTSEKLVDNQQTKRNATELRNQYRPAPSKHAVTEGSEDELSMPNPKEMATGRNARRGGSISKARQAANSGVKRRVPWKAANEGWPLVFARSRDYVCHGSSMDDGRAQIYLRQDSDCWRVFTFDQTEGEFSPRICIRPQDVNTVNVDDDGTRVRLEDRTFKYFARSMQHPWHFEEDFFRDKDTMAKLFSKPLKSNDKVGTSELVHDAITEADDHTQADRQALNTPLLDQLRNISRGENEHQKLEAVSRPVRISTRPTRSTRSSLPSYETEATNNAPKVTKYSVDVGLGLPWNKPVEYGQGRQRAVVDFNDLPRLDEEEYLNDSLIDFYMIYLFNKFNVPSNKVYFFNTYFYTQLTKNTGRQSMNYKAVERWTSKIDVFSYDYIVVPINEATHWYLAIICNVANIDQTSSIEEVDKDLEEALERSRQDLVKADESADKPQPSEPLLGSNNAKPDHTEQIDDDPNLFEEESGLNIVDREDPGVEIRVHDNQVSPASHSPAAETVHAARGASDTDIIPKGILTNLVASPERRKGKRKFTQQKKDPNQPIILILDSLGSVRSGTVRALKDWLAAEGAAKRGIEATIKEKGYYPKASQIPMQSNWTDCGVYLLGYVEKFFQNPDEFKNKLLTAEMSADDDWPELKPKDMRTNMREIIVQIAKEQEVARRKEKKAKKESSSAKTSPAPIKEPAQPEMQVSQLAQVPSMGPDDDPKEPANLNATNAETNESDAQHPIEDTRPRLGSPFNPEPQHIKTATRSPTPVAAKEVSQGPISPVKAIGTLPHLRHSPRRISPEVRIPIKTPQSVASERRGKTSSDRTERQSEHVRSPVNAFQSSSPTKRPRQDEDDSQLRLPVAKTHIRSPRQQKSNPIRRSSPLMPRRREGSADRPIQINDSQDEIPVAITAFKYQQTAGASSPRKTPSRTPRRPNVLRHTSSIEEIPGPAAHAIARHHSPRGQQLIGHLLEAELDHADHERHRTRRSTARSPTTPKKNGSLYQKRGTEAMTIDLESQDADTMDLETYEARPDAMVRETPEALRSSPRLHKDGSLQQ